MTIKSINDLLKEHPFFSGLNEAYIELISGCGRNRVYETGSYIARENEPADYFYLIRTGKVMIETFVPQRGMLKLQTLQGGDIVGWSWMFPPYRWEFDIRVRDTVHAVELDGRCLRGKCETDTRLGYELLQRFAHVMTTRLKHTRIQLLDVYGMTEK